MSNKKRTGSTTLTSVAKDLALFLNKKNNNHNNKSYLHPWVRRRRCSAAAQSHRSRQCRWCWARAFSPPRTGCARATRPVHQSSRWTLARSWKGRARRPRWPWPWPAWSCRSPAGPASARPAAHAHNYYSLTDSHTRFERVCLSPASASKAGMHRILPDAVSGIPDIWTDIRLVISNTRPDAW